MNEPVEQPKSGVLALQGAWERLGMSDAEVDDMIDDIYAERRAERRRGLESKMFIVCDLDGTLADCEHRRHFIRGEGEPVNWEAFYEHCDQDTCVEAVQIVLKTLWNNGHEIAFWSGRMDIGSVREKTLAWLENNGFPMPNFVYCNELKQKTFLRMRPEGDYTPDEELKRSWLNDERENMFRKPDFVLDDRQKVVDMWREEGIQCWQVAKGDF